MRGFFLKGMGGVLFLSGLFVTFAIVGRRMEWELPAWRHAMATWDSLLVLWIAWMVQTHFASRNRKVAATAMPVGLALTAACWYAPQAYDVGLVYLHPLVALWFLDRELGRRRPEWRGAYRACLACVPLLLGAIWWRLGNAPPLPGGQDMLVMRIQNHAGAEILSGLSPHALVSTHTFLEMLHYGVWLVAVPLLSLKVAPWRLPSAPLIRRSRAWRLGVAGVLGAGLLVVLGLWAGFLADYALTRDVYFTVAIAHVLAEVPFLLRTF